MNLIRLATMVGLASICMPGCGGGDSAAPGGGTCVTLKTMDWVLSPTQGGTDDLFITDLAVDSAKVYFSASNLVGSASLAAAPVAIPTKLYEPAPTTIYTHFLLDGARLLISSDGAKFVSVPVAGGAATPLSNFPYPLESTLSPLFNAMLVNGVVYGRSWDTKTTPTTYTYFSYDLAAGTSKVLATSPLTGGTQFAVAGDYLITKDIQGSATTGNQTHTLYRLPTAGGELQKWNLTPAPFPNVYVIGSAGPSVYVLAVPTDQLTQKAQVLRASSTSGATETVLTMTALAFPKVFQLATANNTSYLNVADKIYSLPATGAGKQVACFDYVGYTTQAFTVDSQYAYVSVYQSDKKTSGIARVKLP